MPSAPLLAQGIRRLQAADDAPRRQDNCRAVDERTAAPHFARPFGFKKMMPNDRGIEMLRFSNEEQALNGTSAVEKLERLFRKSTAFPTFRNRQALIRHWWPAARKTA